jgi:serine phosphatase RsbU (regulator of sigma subunit)
MTDGLPELFDASRAMVGYEEALALAGAAVGGPPGDVVERLNRAASEWIGECPQGDDITFLVLRMKPEVPSGNGQMHTGSGSRSALALR